MVFSGKIAAVVGPLLLIPLGIIILLVREMQQEIAWHIIGLQQFMELLWAPNIQVSLMKAYMIVGVLCSQALLEDISKYSAHMHYT